MKLHYFLEYVSTEKNKHVRSDLGYDINQAEAAAYIHLKKGDVNVAILPVIEDCDKNDDHNFDNRIIDVEVEVRPDEENTSN